MIIAEIEARDIPRIVSFLLPYERFCIPLMARVQLQTVPIYAIFTDAGSLCGVFTFSKAGQIFHCLPCKTPEDKKQLLRVLSHFFETKQDHAFFSINGESYGTKLLLQAVQNGTKHVAARHLHYDFMRAAVDSHAQEMKGFPCKILRCSPSMAESLFPLQTAYEKEEVVFNLDTYSEDVSFLSLKKALREQAVYAVFDKAGSLVAKGGTNAQGSRYVQLGGVYTVPHERKKGYASALIRHIVLDFASKGIQTALFVKPQNVAAQRLYAACGFEKYGVYESAYF